MFKPKRMFWLLVKGASVICSAAPRVSLTPQLGREVRMLMANSPPGTSIGT